MWTEEAVNAVLATYTSDKARAEHLKVEIENITQLIAEMEKSVAANAAAIGAQALTGMPHGSGISDPTASTAIRLASGWEGEDIEQLKAEKRDYEAELKQRLRTVAYVDAWLTALTEREAWLIRKQVLNGEFWRDIVDDYSRDYQFRISQDTLARIKQKAMRKIYRAAGVKNMSGLTNTQSEGGRDNVGDSDH